ncbi:MAG: WecB/TagA/CpsF family glycosyltransferase [bacterium]|nr:WecB/TagA/CpsF family glycosyltransferase [bacterium]
MLLSISIGEEKISDILDKVNTFLSKKEGKFYHIANLNPDIFSLAYRDNNFRSIINGANSILIDGIGIKFAAKLFGKNSGERMTGTDLMGLLVEYAAKNRKKVMFLGGKENSADFTGKNFKKKFSNLNYTSSNGAYDIKSETMLEKKNVLIKIKEFKPDFLFVAYGPPYQEKWIYENKENLKGIVCMGVGGAFNFIAGKVIRAPKIITSAGFEWLWRFIFEPARIRKLPRQISFLFLIFYFYLKFEIGKLSKFII